MSNMIGFIGEFYQIPFSDFCNRIEKAYYLSDFSRLEDEIQKELIYIALNIPPAQARPEIFKFTVMINSCKNKSPFLDAFKNGMEGTISTVLRIIE